MTESAATKSGIAPKSLDESFIDWEATAFGFGYGSGEGHVLGALKMFFAAFGMDGRPNSYDHAKLEQAVGGPVAWLLINRLCSHQIDAIEYGTSPRFGWLTPHGEALKAYVDSKSAEYLEELVCSTTENTTICYPDACNCGPNGYVAGRRCPNPFWKER